MILAGTIGGTKTVLALFDRTTDGSGGGIRLIRLQKFSAEETPSLDRALDAFLRPRDTEALTGSCFGVAGPVVDGTVRITNLNWTIEAKTLSSRFGGIEVTLLNDLQAVALGSTILSDDKFVVLQPRIAPTVSEPAITVPTGRASRSFRAVSMPIEPPIAVMALGTGLGEATLIHDGMRYKALPSEGGHADFAASTDDEIALLQYLRGRYGHVSYERVLSGAGLGEIYNFVRARSGEREPTWLSAEIAAGDPNAAIAAAAVGERRDGCCVRAIEMFAEILGSEASNIALRAVAGSVVIGGGIPHKLLPVLQSGGLIRRFNAKGRFSRWTSTVGVRVLVEPRAGLLGAAHHAVASR